MSRGDLEDYLPVGYRSKDTQKLIELVSLDDFWERLDPDVREVLEHMAMDFLGIPGETPVPAEALPPEASQEAVGAPQPAA